MFDRGEITGIEMGAWNNGILDNDDACDWVCELETADFNFVRGTLETLLQAGDDYIEAPEGCMALAACEVIARLKGKPPSTPPAADRPKAVPRPHMSERVDVWIEANPTDIDSGLVDLALKVIDRIKDADSELAELWEEVGDEEWLAVLDALRQRIAQP